MIYQQNWESGTKALQIDMSCILTKISTVFATSTFGPATKESQHEVLATTKASRYACRSLHLVSTIWHKHTTTTTCILWAQDLTKMRSNCFEIIFLQGNLLQISGGGEGLETRLASEAYW